MKKWIKNRYVQLGIIFTGMFGILIFQLYYLTIVEGETYYTESESVKRIELTLVGERGEILDRSGIPLAANTQVYVIQLDRQRIPTKNEDINALLAEVLQTIVDNGDRERLTSAMPIKYDIEQNRFYFSWEMQEAETQNKKLMRWLKDIDALNSDGTIYDKKFNGVREDDVESVLDYLRRRYEISDEYSDDLARMIAAVRLDIYLNRYRQYDPIYVASAISLKTLAKLETHMSGLEGVRVVVEQSRYYPMNESAAHIIGYAGKISSQDDIEVLEEKGYDPARDKIGKGGIEKYAEQWLTGSTIEKQGKLVAEVDSMMRVIRVLDEEPPKDGNDVMLTIDSRLQRSVETIIEEELEQMRNGEDEYASEKKVAPLAQKAAAVVMDVNTGEILAMASYPSYDINPFVNGISNKQYQEILNAPGQPLYALAFQGQVIPGSVFKMVVGMAGLMEGVITPNTTIYDKITYDFGDRGISCWIKPGSHGSETLVEAIEHSCNYYFIDLAMRLGIDKVEKWADAFGLSDATGLEIIDAEKEARNNTVGGPGAKLAANSASRNQYEIKFVMQKYYGYETMSKESLDALTNLEMTDDSRVNGTKIRETLLKYKYFVFKDNNEDGLDDETGRTKDQLERDSYNATGTIKYTLTSYLNWLPIDTGNTAIGQGYTTLSPLVVARYISAIANGGTVLEAHVVQKVLDANTGEALVENYIKDNAYITDTFDEEGNLIDRVEKPLVNAGVNQEYLDVIKYGMYQVVNDSDYSGGGRGTAYSYFATQDDSITVAGKTGTAEVVGDNELRNNAWFASFTPYENPQIAVVVAIENGRTSGNAAPVARRIIDQYYALKDDKGQTDIKQDGILYR